MIVLFGLASMQPEDRDGGFDAINAPEFAKTVEQMAAGDWLPKFECQGCRCEIENKNRSFGTKRIERYGEPHCAT